MMRKYFCLGLFGALLMAASLFAFAMAYPNPQALEEFHQTYQISENGRITLNNISGNVSIKGWDRSEVRVDAVKKAYRQERLADVEIQVDADSSSVRIKSKYRSNSLTWNDQGWNSDNNPPTVDYTLMVPINARIEKVNVVNSSIDISELTGVVEVSSVNGRIRASKLSGGVSLSTVNGTLEAAFDQLKDSQHVHLSSVNGTVILAIPSGVDAEINANTVHGGINNDFGWEVTRGQYVGHYMSGVIGSGGPRITLGNVNGSISVRKGSGEPMIPAITISFREENNKTRLTDNWLSDHDRDYLNKRRQTLEQGRARLDQKSDAVDRQRKALDIQRASLDGMREELYLRRDVTLEERKVVEAERVVLDAERTALENVRTMLDKQRSALNDDLIVIKAQLDENDGSDCLTGTVTKSGKDKKNKGR